MNIQKANSYMLAASTDVSKSYWFCLSMILLLCLEILLAFVIWCIFAVKGGKAPKELILQIFNPKNQLTNSLKVNPTTIHQRRSNLSRIRLQSLL